MKIRRRKEGLLGSKELERLSNSLKNLVVILDENPNYQGHSYKPYVNKGGVLPGNGPFSEYVAKGNKQRLVRDDSNGFLYVTLDHHKTYFEVE